MPQPTRAQLVLAELAGAAVVGGLAGHGPWLVAGGAGGAVLLALAVIPLGRRWLYQVLLSWGGLWRRRRQSRRVPGLAGLVGEYTVSSVAGGGRGATIGVVRSGTTWCVPLVLDLEGLFNDDAPVPVDLLAGLLEVEDVPLSSVRLLTLISPARVPANAPAGPAAPMTALAARYCLLTLDTRRAADAIAARGGSQAAVDQILRRCVVHARRVLATAGVKVRRLDEAGVASLFATWMGPATSPNGRRSQQTVETWKDVRVAGTWSTVFAVSGEGPDVTDRVFRLASVAPAPVVATCLVLQPSGARGAVEATMLVRLSAPDAVPPEGAARSLRLMADAYDLVMQRPDGEQGQLLRATTPVGIGEPG